MTSAVEYHLATSHAPDRLQGRELDWANRPEVFKRYPADAVSRELALPDCAFAAAQSLPMLLQGGQAMAGRPGPGRLANVLGLAAGITQTRVHGDGRFHYRSWPSAGALFPCELYLALGEAWHGADDTDDAAGLTAGVWHHQPESHSLTLLRHGDALGVAALAAGLPQALSQAQSQARDGGVGLAGIACITAILHRSAWKYGARAYRYVLLDAGHLAENLLLALALEGFGAMWAVDFKDDAMNALLGLDAERECCLLALPFFSGHAPEGFASTPAPAGPLGEFLDRDAVRQASRCAPVERTWPAMLGVHRAGAIEERFVGRAEAAPEQAADCFLVTPTQELPLADSAAVFAERLWPSAARCLLSRRSQRRFSREPVPVSAVQALCHLLSERTLQDRGGRNVAVALAVQQVEGLAAGLYLLDRARRALGLLQAGVHHGALAAACLGQHWMAQAAVHVCLVADIAGCEAQWGPRSYRALGLAAGRLGERAYLAATSLGWGACGVGAFFDAAAAAVLQLAPAAQLLYAVAVGPVRQDGR